MGGLSARRARGRPGLRAAVSGRGYSSRSKTSRNWSASKDSISDVTEPRRRGSSSWDLAWTGSWIVAATIGALLVGILFAQLIRGRATGIRAPLEACVHAHTHVTLRGSSTRCSSSSHGLGTNITLLPPSSRSRSGSIVRGKAARPRCASGLVQLGSFTLNAVLKGIFDRPRPDLFELRGQHAWAAFPSGHAIASVSVLLTIAMLLRRERAGGGRWGRGRAAAVSLYSRLYLGVHGRLTFVGGVWVGLVWLGATYTAFAVRWWRKRAGRGEEQRPATVGDAGGCFRLRLAHLPAGDTSAESSRVHVDVGAAARDEREHRVRYGRRPARVAVWCQSVRRWPGNRRRCSPLSPPRPCDCGDRDRVVRGGCWRR